MKNNKSIKQLVKLAATATAKINYYKFLVILALVAIVYGFIFLRIQALNATTPSPTQVSAQPNPTIGAHIDKHVVNQLKQLRDNSVNVQALFNQGRSNPFQE